jgi:FixJ family two-component response regulator
MKWDSVSLVSIVSEDAQFRKSVKALVESAGLQANTFPTLQAMLDTEEQQSRDCLVFHSEENALNDPAQQERLRVACIEWLAIVITERDNVRTAVQAMKAGVRSVVQKPYRDSELLDHIKTLVDTSETV